MALVKTSPIRILYAEYEYHRAMGRIGEFNEIFTYIANAPKIADKLRVYEIDGNKMKLIPKSEWLPWALRVNTVSAAAKEKLNKKYGGK